MTGIFVNILTIKMSKALDETPNNGEDFNSQENYAKELPEYCYYNKFLLIEEVVLQRDFTKLHHGRCTVIGRLQQHQNGYFILENVKLTAFPRAYILPEGSLSIRLFKFADLVDALLMGKYCEIFGEVVLWNTENPCNNWIPLTTRSLLEMVMQQHSDELERKAKLDELQKKYLPAINIFKLDYIECNPAELIKRHLSIRLLRVLTS